MAASNTFYFLFVALAITIVYAIWSERRKDPRYSVYISGRTLPYSTRLREDTANMLMKRFARKGIVTHKVKE